MVGRVSGLDVVKIVPCPPFVGNIKTAVERRTDGDLGVSMYTPENVIRCHTREAVIH